MNGTLVPNLPVSPLRPKPHLLSFSAVLATVQRRATIVTYSISVLQQRKCFRGTPPSRPIPFLSLSFTFIVCPNLLHVTLCAIAHCWLNLLLANPSSSLKVVNRSFSLSFCRRLEAYLLVDDLPTFLCLFPSFTLFFLGFISVLHSSSESEIID